jgi:hypothetical protein
MKAGLCTLAVVSMALLAQCELGIMPNQVEDYGARPYDMYVENYDLLVRLSCCALF